MPAPVTTDHISLRLDRVGKVLGGRSIVADLDLDVRPGEMICLLGPSGCGKTTTLRMIGGFLTPDTGRVLIDGVDHTATAPEARPTAMVFQNYALWPHMSVYDNVAFGLRVRRVDRAQIRRRVEEVVELVGLTHHLRSRPGQISGGEQQRVALARALVLRPSLLLLDEPLSNLDAKLRIRVREEIRRIQRHSGITTVVVTHDQEEALALADRIAVMNDGRVEQFATPEDIYRRPVTPFVARFVGSMNLLDVTTVAAGTRLELPDVGTLPLTGPIEAGSAADGPVTDGQWQVGIRPEDLILERPESGPGTDVSSTPVDPTDAGARSGLLGTVVRDLPLGHYREVVVSSGDQELTVFETTGRRHPGEQVRVHARRAIAFPVSADPGATHQQVAATAVAATGSGSTAADRTGVA